MITVRGEGNVLVLVLWSQYHLLLCMYQTAVGLGPTPRAGQGVAADHATGVTGVDLEVGAAPETVPGIVPGTVPGKGAAQGTEVVHPTPVPDPGANLVPVTAPLLTDALSPPPVEIMTNKVVHQGKMSSAMEGTAGQGVALAPTEVTAQ